MLCQFVRVVLTKYPTLGGLNNRNLTVLEAHSLSSRGGQRWFLLELGGKDLCQASLLGLTMAVSMFIWCSSSMQVCLQTSSIHKDTNPTGLGPHLMTSFNRIITLKTFSPNTATFCSKWWLGLQPKKLGGDTVQPITLRKFRGFLKLCARNQGQSRDSLYYTSIITFHCSFRSEKHPWVLTNDYGLEINSNKWFCFAA